MLSKVVERHRTLPNGVEHFWTFSHIIDRSVFERSQSFSHILAYSSTFIEAFERPQAFSNGIERCCTSFIVAKHSRTLPDVVNNVKQYQTIPNDIKQCRILLNYIDLQHIRRCQTVSSYSKSNDIKHYQRNQTIPNDIERLQTLSNDIG